MVRPVFVLWAKAGREIFGYFACKLAKRSVKCPKQAVSDLKFYLCQRRTRHGQFFDSADQAHLAQRQAPRRERRIGTRITQSLRCRGPVWGGAILGHLCQIDGSRLGRLHICLPQTAGCGRVRRRRTAKIARETDKQKLTWVREPCTGNDLRGSLEHFGTKKEMNDVDRHKTATGYY